jgi:ribosomal protein S7
MNSIQYKNYNSNLFKLILKILNNKLLKCGKNTQSKKILINVIKELKINRNLSDRNMLLFFETTLKKVFVRFIIKRRKKGKMSQEIPVPLNNITSIYSNTIQLLLKDIRKQAGNSFHLLLMKELLDIQKNQGSVKKRIMDLNKVVIKNRKFII